MKRSARHREAKLKELVQAPTPFLNQHQSPLHSQEQTSTSQASSLPALDQTSPQAFSPGRYLTYDKVKEDASLEMEVDDHLLQDQKEDEYFHSKQYLEDCRKRLFTKVVKYRRGVLGL